MCRQDSNREGVLGATPGSTRTAWSTAHPHYTLFAYEGCVTTRESLHPELERFEREARVTATLRSPHTTELFDFGTAGDGTFHYVMELLDGIDLDSLVMDFGPQPAGRVTHVLHLLAWLCGVLASHSPTGV